MYPKKTAEECPKCHEISLWHNKGISTKNGKPYENVKCSKCGYLEWKEPSEAPLKFQRKEPFSSQKNTPNIDPIKILTDEIISLRTEIKEIKDMLTT